MKDYYNWLIAGFIFSGICVLIMPFAVYFELHGNHHLWEILTIFQVGSLLAQVICIIIAKIVKNRYGN